MLTLSDVELRGLERVLTILLSPLDFESAEDWGVAAMASMQPLLKYDQALLGHTLGETMSIQGIGRDLERAAREYAAHFQYVDTGMTQRRRHRRLEAYHRDDLYDPATFSQTEIYADWCAPYWLLDPIGMSVELDLAYPAALHLYHDSESRDRFGERGLALLRLLLPAYKAGLHTCCRLSRRREELKDLFDHSGDAILIADTAGAVVHRNRRLTKLLSGDPESERVVGEALSMAACVLSLVSRRNSAAPADSRSKETASSWRLVRTARATYRLFAFLLGEATMGTRAHAAVVMVPTASQPMDAERLRAEYHLTARETDVAHLLAAGKSTRDIANAMCISSHTARHHTESVMRKLGVRRRAEVGARLRGDA